MGRPPPGFLLTWSTYGTWLHGDERGSVDRATNRYGTALLEPDAPLRAAMRRVMAHEPVVLSAEMRGVVDRAVRDHAALRGWRLAALNVRTNHVHAVVLGVDADPSQLVREFKTWGTRRLREAGLVDADRRVWTAHGSTRYLYETGSVEGAVRYVAEGQ